MKAPAALLAAALLLFLPVALSAAEPIAFFSFTTNSVNLGANVTANARDSEPSDAATSIVEYAWSWGGEDFVVGNATMTHLYEEAGLFVVTLRVTDDTGAVAFVNQSVLVRGQHPNAYFQLDQIVVGGSVEARVNATFSEPSPGAGAIVRYEWDWGDGNGYQDGNVTETHVYSDAGAYTIRLRVTDDAGRTDAVNEPVLVKSTFFSRMGQVVKEREAFLRGAQLTILLAVLTTIIGFVLAIVVALMRINRLAVIRWPAAAYIEVIRGTPLLVQILIAWLVLPFFGLKLPILWAGALALVVNTSAYQAEAIRAGIQAIPSGQLEAATSLGLNYFQAMRHVVLPQAFRLTLPALGNEFIILLKDTSLVSVIGVVELTQVGRIFSARSFLVLETWLAVAFVYFVMTYALSQGLRYLERRLAIPGMGVTGVAT